MREGNCNMTNVLPVSSGRNAGVVGDGPEEGVWTRDIDMCCNVRRGVRDDRVVKFKDPLWREQLVGWDRREPIGEWVFFQQDFQ